MSIFGAHALWKWRRREVKIFPSTLGVAGQDIAWCAERRFAARLVGLPIGGSGSRQAVTAEV